MTATRQHALDALANYLPKASNYARYRNFDTGPGGPLHVSRLSPYIRTRLITEEEVCRAVIARHGIHAPEKFLQEVAWRAYWKGWLELRPAVWHSYLEQLRQLIPDDSVRQAIDGQTGIDCFDTWAHELTATGYLHNHARMWFASIWIFTLKLPWQLGAEFFLHHLLDADPASNTLSWRWVAGLHTPGKHYLARAENIRTFTQGRFNPTRQLDESAPPLPANPVPAPVPPDFPPPLPASGKIGHLLLPDDLSPISALTVATAGWIPDHLPSHSTQARSFLTAALDDTLARHQGERLHGDLSTAAAAWARRTGLDAIAITRPTTGPWRDLLAGFDPGIPVHFHTPDWDRRLWPHATAGFFRFRSHLPRIFNELRDA
jgi:deoxyribodipyrimidine photo-lyase